MSEPIVETPPPDSPPEGEPQTFDAEYVTKLRDENAKHRREKKEAEARNTEYSQRLLSTLVASVCSDLADPSDLLTWTPQSELLDEDGYPDREKILAAQESLLSRKPHLRTRDARGDIDQGGRGEEVETFSFNDWIRSAAH